VSPLLLIPRVFSVLDVDYFDICVYVCDSGMVWCSCFTRVFSCIYKKISITQKVDCPA
jgi:hypothetical protein